MATNRRCGATLVNYNTTYWYRSYFQTWTLTSNNLAALTWVKKKNLGLFGSLEMQFPVNSWLLEMRHTKELSLTVSKGNSLYLYPCFLFTMIKAGSPEIVHPNHRPRIEGVK